MDFVPPFDQIGVNPPGPWQNANPDLGIEGSIPNAVLFDIVQNEILNVQDEAGITRNGADKTQLLQAIRSGKLIAFADTGTADALVVTPRTAYTALAFGAEITVLKGAAANATTTPTLSVSGLVRQIVKEDGTALGVGDLPGTCLFKVTSDGSKLRVLGLRKSDAVLSGSTLNTSILNAIANSITTIAPQVLNALQSLSSFTPVVVLSDLPYNTDTVIKTLSIPSGTSYMRAKAQAAFRNDNTSNRISFTSKLRLTDSSGGIQYGQYIGGAIPLSSGGAGLQLEQQVDFEFKNLDKTKSYTLDYIGSKIDNYSNLVILDGYIYASFG